MLWKVPKLNEHVAYPFTHEAIVLWKANKLERSFLYEERIEDPYLRGIPGHIVRYRLPEALCSLLKKKTKKQEREIMIWSNETEHPSLITKCIMKNVWNIFVSSFRRSEEIISSIIMSSGTKPIRCHHCILMAYE